jgi:ribosomal protein S18 acetylase RimI-like enzyme
MNDYIHTLIALISAFYEKFGFKEFRRIKDYVVDNYDAPIYENGVQLREQICLRYEF